MAKLSRYASVSETRNVLQRHGLATKHALGQNFLVNDDILRKITELAQLDKADDVLEIGPGIGTLTVALLQQAHSVVSIECDPDLPAVLAETTAPWANRFALIERDALKVVHSNVQNAFRSIQVNENTARAFPNKLIANLPYAVAATVVLDYFQRFVELESMTVMVQREVADRMMAHPNTKDYGAFTVKLSFFAQPAGRFAVSPGNFFPPPRVDSAVIRLNRRQDCAKQGACLSEQEIRAACLMADAAFTTRRKTLANSCKTFFLGKGDQDKRVVPLLPALFQQANIDARRRGETLSQQEFIALARAYLELVTHC